MIPATASRDEIKNQVVLDLLDLRARADVPAHHAARADDALQRAFAAGLHLVPFSRSLYSCYENGVRPLGWERTRRTSDAFLAEWAGLSREHRDIMCALAPIGSLIQVSTTNPSPCAHQRDWDAADRLDHILDEAADSFGCEGWRDEVAPLLAELRAMKWPAEWGTITVSNMNYIWTLRASPRLRAIRGQATKEQLSLMHRVYRMVSRYWKARKLVVDGKVPALLPPSRLKADGWPRANPLRALVADVSEATMARRQERMDSGEWPASITDKSVAEAARDGHVAASDKSNIVRAITGTAEENAERLHQFNSSYGRKCMLLFHHTWIRFDSLSECATYVHLYTGGDPEVEYVRYNERKKGETFDGKPNYLNFTWTDPDGDVSHHRWYPDLWVKRRGSRNGRWMEVKGTLDWDVLGALDISLSNRPGFTRAKFLAHEGKVDWFDGYALVQPLLDAAARGDYQLKLYCKDTKEFVPYTPSAVG